MSDYKIWYYYVEFDEGNFLGHCLSTHTSKHKVVAYAIDKAETDRGKPLNIHNYYAYPLEFSQFDDEGLELIQQMINKEKELRGIV